MSADYFAIQNQLARFARALDQRDWAAVPTIFAADVGFDYGEGERQGLEALCAQFRRYLDQCGPTQHLLGSLWLEVNGETAQSRAYVQARHQGTGARARLLFDSHGDYHDRWEKRGATWLIVRRDVHWLIQCGDPAVIGFGA